MIVLNEAGLRKLMDSVLLVLRTVPARARRYTRTHRFLVGSRRPAMAPSWRFRRSVASIIDTNAARPERSSRRRLDAHDRGGAELSRSCSRNNNSASDLQRRSQPSPQPLRGACFPPT
jgi:hypothetical protein